MSLVLAGAAIIVIGILTAFAMVFRRLMRPGAHPADANWLEYLSIERYRPMMMLLDERDLASLAAHTEGASGGAAGLRRRRARLFLAYLRSLNDDFSRVCSAIKLLMVHSQVDRPDLAVILLRSRIRFVYGMMAAHFQLILFRYGLPAPDVAPLVNMLQSLRVELGSLQPAACAVPV